jgi:hypothetical protein
MRYVRPVETIAPRPWRTFDEIIEIFGDLESDLDWDADRDLVDQRIRRDVEGE